MWTNRETSVGLAASVAVAVVTAGFSLTRVLTYDESYWLAIARRVLDGSMLYVDVVDNKGPLLYITFASLDVLPGSFEIWRAAAVACAAGMIAHLGAGLLVDLGARRSAAVSIASVTALHSVTLSSFALSTELLAAVFVVAAFRIQSDRPTLAVLLVLLSAGFDPRSLLFSIPLAIALGIIGLRRPAVRLLGLAAIAVMIGVFSLAPLRFSLVELSTATRFGDSWIPAQQALVAATALLPTVALAITARLRSTASWQPAFALTALAIGGISLFPFTHYWVYFGLLPLLFRAEPRTPALAVAAMFVLIGPALLIQDIDIDRDERQWNRAEEAASLVADRPYTDRLLIWSELPQLTTQFATQTDLSAPSINILGWATSRQDELLAELGTSLSTADVILIEAPITDMPPGLEPFATVRSAVDAAGCESGTERPFACVVDRSTGESSIRRPAP